MRIASIARWKSPVVPFILHKLVINLLDKLNLAPIYIYICMIYISLIACVGLSLLSNTNLDPSTLSGPYSHQ